MPTFWHRNRTTTEPVLAPRTGSPVKRDVHKAATAGVTGLTAFGALAVTGAVAGVAAHDKAVQDAQKVVPPAAPAPQVVEKRRPHRTVVRTRVVHQASAPAVVRPATGGTVSAAAPTHVSSTSTVTHAAPKPAPRPAPKPAPAPAPKPAPKPAPAPAPSSGS